MLYLAVLAAVTRLHDGRDKQCFCHICVRFNGQMHIFGSNYNRIHTLCLFPL